MEYLTRTKLLLLTVRARHAGFLFTQKESKDSPFGYLLPPSYFEVNN